VFLLVALYLYFVPFTGAEKVSVPFFVLLLISFLQGNSILAAVIFGAIFYFIILIKDLLIIDRRSAYDILVLVLSYLLIRNFFLRVGGSLEGWTVVYSLVAAGAVSGMVTSFIKNFSTAWTEADSPEARSFRRMLGWMTFLLMWQLLLVGLFLPLDFLYQSAIIFLVAVIMIDLLPQYIFGELSRTKVLVTGMVLFALVTIVATSARWVL